MADIDYPRFYRLATRCQELASRAGVSATVSEGFTSVLAPLLTAYKATHDALPAAEAKAAKERGEGFVALGKIDQPYRVARAAVLLHRPYESLPETLKMQPTDTDKLNAVQALLHVLEAADAAHETWAGPLLTGEFGTLAPEVVREVSEAIAASTDLSHAVQARSAAYQPAYDAYLRFKNVVRQVFGATSREYHSIHIRAGHASDADPTAGTPAAAPPAAPPTTPSA